MNKSGSTHERLRCAAAELFARRGYGGTSMSEIADLVGVRKASLYNYYPSKAELLLDLLDRSLMAWEAACQPSFEQEGSCEDRLAAYLDAVVSFVDSNPQAVAIVRQAATQIGGDLGKRARDQLAEHEHKFVQFLTGFFAEAAESGEVEMEDAKHLSLFCCAFVDGLVINRLFGTERSEQYVTHMSSLWKLFWRGASGEFPHARLS